MRSPTLRSAYWLRPEGRGVICKGTGPDILPISPAPPLCPRLDHHTYAVPSSCITTLKGIALGVATQLLEEQTIKDLPNRALGIDCSTLSLRNGLAMHEHLLRCGYIWHVSPRA